MKINLLNYNIYYNNNQLKSASEILNNEIFLRTGFCVVSNNALIDKKYNFILKIDDESKSEEYSLLQSENDIILSAHRLRGILYAIGLIFRKSTIVNSYLYIDDSAFGTYLPKKDIRGHQLSYTDMNNTLDAWDYDKFYRYILELEMFGVNMIEADSGDKCNHNKLMIYSADEALKIKSEICKFLDLDFSIWCPMSSKETDDESVEKLKNRFKGLPKLDVLFIPGGDPGDLSVKKLFNRSKKIKTALCIDYPEVELWISAQAPHNVPNWGEDFLFRMNQMPDYIDGVIFGPNHPVSITELRRSVPLKYPIRLYPDIGHNVCCEIPVHFNIDDWHYSFASALNRECVNPRPEEFNLYNRLFSPYTVGSCTYSEGVNDDVNKFVWSLLELENDANVNRLVDDYCRFFFSTSSDRIYNIILSLEKHWNGDPVYNVLIDYTYKEVVEILDEYPLLINNWRFVLILFRCCCDKLIRERRIFELNLIDNAFVYAKNNDVSSVVKTLETPYDVDYIDLRNKIDDFADVLYNLIGIQLSVDKYNGLNWERGCTLDTIDNPVTDRSWLLQKIKNDKTNMIEYFDRYSVRKYEHYFSFAIHGFPVSGKQTDDYYLDFNGGENKLGKIPVGCLTVYDHFYYKTTVSGLFGKEYYLRITYKKRVNPEIIHHRIRINGNVLYDGKQYGGNVDRCFTDKFLPEGFVSVVYDIPDCFIINGCIILEIDEPLYGFTISEYWIKMK